MFWKINAKTNIIYTFKENLKKKSYRGSPLGRKILVETTLHIIIKTNFRVVGMYRKTEQNYQNM